jgi:hypothetical protein
LQLLNIVKDDFKITKCSSKMYYTLANTWMTKVDLHITLEMQVPTSENTYKGSRLIPCGEIIALWSENCTEHKTQCVSNVQSFWKLERKERNFWG